MFDIDGTLIDSSGFEDRCYLKAVESVVCQPVETDWTKYEHVTDTGILNEIINTLDLTNERDRIHLKVRQLFLEFITSHISISPVKEIPGAGAFINRLKDRDDVVLAIATGGWAESAQLKLNSAGVDYTGMYFASSDTHPARIEIMKQAEKKCRISTFTSKTYFGDAVWDKRASHILDYNFILVGNRTNHQKQINDFIDAERVLSLIGL